jgi:hypothetical protein
VQPQQYPPQGYAPQPQQQYAPPQYGQPYPQQGYPQPQYAPPAAPQYAPPAPPQAPPAAPQQYAAPVAPDRPAATVLRPRLQDFGRDGRLVMISPTKIERGLPNRLGKPGDVQDRMTADVVILDGAPFPFGGAPEKGQPHTTSASAPYEVPAMFISSAPLISQCERRIGESVLGRLRIVQLENGNSAYRIDDPTQADFDACNAFIAAKVAGRVAPPQQAPQAAPQQAAYAPPPQQAAYMTQPATLPPYAGAQPPAAPPYGGIPAQQPMPQQQPAYGPPPAQQLDIDTVPNTNPPTDPNWWAAQPPEYRQMVVASLASQQRPGV